MSAYCLRIDMALGVLAAAAQVRMFGMEPTAQRLDDHAADLLAANLDGAA